jgi:glucokinase
MPITGYDKDFRTVMTLDAGGTNFVFSAIRGNQEVVTPITLPSNGHDLRLCLETMTEGFRKVHARLREPAVAISFAFPAPADYPNGIIGDLLNLPGFRGGVAVGPMLSEQFGLPVFINNDGDLYTYGEALSGFLPEINARLEEAGSPKRFKNLFGITLGTGFGGGLVRDGRLYQGDNSMASEVWLLRNKLNTKTNAEEGVSIRATQRVYAELTGTAWEDAPSPKEIFDIGMGSLPGNRSAAVEAYRQLGEVLGDALGNILTITDSLAVIGGGVAGARELIVPAMMKELRGEYENYKGKRYYRLIQRAYYLDDEGDLQDFLQGDSRTIVVPGSSNTLHYDPLARIGIGFSRLGASKAIALGAYAYALNALDTNT